jgi:hypothetical protein
MVNKEEKMTSKGKMHSTNKTARKENSMPAQTEKLRPEQMSCATCGIRRRAEANPESIWSRLWKWHTGWCPKWKVYQGALAEAGEEVIQELANF